MIILILIHSLYCVLLCCLQIECVRLCVCADALTVQEVTAEHGVLDDDRCKRAETNSMHGRDLVAHRRTRLA